MTEDKKDTYETLEFLLGDDWKKISQEHKKILTDKYDQAADASLEKTGDLFKRISARRETQAIFFLGISFGILGNIAASYLDAFFRPFGFIYYFIAIAAFGITLWQINKAFNKGISRITRSNPTLKAMIMEKKENVSGTI